MSEEHKLLSLHLVVVVVVVVMKMMLRVARPPASCLSTAAALVPYRTSVCRLAPCRWVLTPPHYCPYSAVTNENTALRSAIFGLLFY